MAASLTHIARQLGGDVANRRTGQILCPGPGHSKRDRSLSVWMSSTSLADFTVKSYVHDDFAACKDHVRALLGLAQWQPQGRDDRQGVVATTPTPPRRRIDDKEDVATSSSDPNDAERIARALAPWHSRDAVAMHGTLGERYLVEHRKVILPWQADGEALRFNPRTPWRDEATGELLFVPCMLALMRDNLTEEPTGLHRTRLDADGRKLGRRMIGRAAGSSVHLCPMSALGAGVCLAEGIESALAGWAIGWSNVWAACSVGAVERFPVLPYTQSLVLLAENDASGASARAVDIALARWAAAGREVLVVTPHGPGDANDAIRGDAA